MLIGKASPEDMNLHPIQYQWAYDLYQQAVRNTWFPHEIALKEDLYDWEKMTDDERHAVKFLMAFFNPGELIVNRSIALGIYPYLKSPECHLYLAKQMWEEANHCVSFEYVLETFPLDRTNVFNLHLDTPSMKAKEDYINKYMRRMTEDTLDVETPEGKKDFIRNLVATNIVMEGIWFYSGFMVVLSFRQRNQLRNFGSMINWVIRDESLHLKFGMNLIQNILEENRRIAHEGIRATRSRQIVDRRRGPRSRLQQRPLPARHPRLERRLREPVRAVRRRPAPGRARHRRALRREESRQVDGRRDRRPRARQFL